MNRIFLYGSEWEKRKLIDEIFSEILEKHAEGGESRKRLEYEIDIIKQTGNEERIATFIDEIRDARKESLWLTGQSNNTYVLNGSYYIDGAANCSYLLYRAGITKVNALKLNLPFERFINPLFPTQTPIFGIAVAKKQKNENDQASLDDQTMQALIEYTELYTDDIWDPRPMPIAWTDEEKQIRAKHQPIVDILAESRGHLIWQEQILHLLNVLGGYSYAEADCIRKNLAKRKLDTSQILELRDKILNGAFKLGYLMEDVDELFKDMMAQQAYCYLKAHFASVVLNGDSAINID